MRVKLRIVHKSHLRRLVAVIRGDEIRQDSSDDTAVVCIVIITGRIGHSTAALLPRNAIHKRGLCCSLSAGVRPSDMFVY